MVESGGRDSRRARGRGWPRASEAPDPHRVEDIALIAFATKGYDGTSLRDIALSAGVDPALVSRRFGSKLGLWRATVDALGDQLEEIYEAMRTALDQPAPFPKRCREALRLFVAFNCKMPALSHFFIREIERPGERRDLVTRRIWQPYLATMQPLLQEAIVNGVIIPMDCDYAPVSLLGVVAMPQLVRPLLDQELGINTQVAVDRIMASLMALFMVP